MRALENLEPRLTGPYSSARHASVTSVGSSGNRLRCTGRQAYDHVSDAHLLAELLAASPRRLARETDAVPTITEPTTGGIS